MLRLTDEAIAARARIAHDAAPEFARRKLAGLAELAALRGLALARLLGGASGEQEYR